MRRLPLLQLARFGTVGASNTVLSFAAYALALRLGVRYLPAGAGAFALGALNGFALNRTWTFRARGSALRAGWRYATVQGIGLLATVLLLRLAVHGLGFPRLPAQLVAAVPVTLLCFALSRAWVFGAHRSDDARDPHPPALAPARAGAGARGLWRACRDGARRGRLAFSDARR
jgi:putative flippase GtrA